MRDKINVYDKNDIDIRPPGLGPLTNVLITEIPKVGSQDGKFKGCIFTTWDSVYLNYEFKLKDILGKITGFAPGQKCNVNIKDKDKLLSAIIVGAPGLGGGPYREEPGNGKYHVFVQDLKSQPPDYSNNGYISNISEQAIHYLKEYPEGSPETPWEGKVWARYNPY